MFSGICLQVYMRKNIASEEWMNANGRIVLTRKI
jgi:hypothetical protein